MKDTPNTQQTDESPDSKNVTKADQCQIPPGEADAPSAVAPPEEPGGPQENDGAEEKETELPLSSDQAVERTAEQEEDDKGASNAPGDISVDAGGDGSGDSEVEPIETEQTIPKSIRLWQSAFAALKVLIGKYGGTMADMVSICIIAYAKKAAAAPILRYRMLDSKCLFPLQASANDIKEGLGDFEKDLYKARKSHRDPKERKLLYDQLGDQYQKVLRHAEETLTSMDKECVLHDLLEPSDHTLLIQAITTLKAAKPKAGTETQIRDLYLKIFETLIR